jgi:hypothetical protein
LTDKISQYHSEKDKNLRIPKGRDNSEMLLENLNDDQFKVAYIILSKVKEWVELERKKKP